jgi:hypothetical protein
MHLQYNAAACPASAREFGLARTIARCGITTNSLSIIPETNPASIFSMEDRYGQCSNFRVEPFQQV